MWGVAVADAVKALALVVYRLWLHGFESHEQQQRK